MSKININDFDFYFDDGDKINDVDHEDHAGRKQRTRARRKIEYFVERKKLKEMLYNEDSYWGD